MPARLFRLSEMRASVWDGVLRVCEDEEVEDGIEEGKVMMLWCRSIRSRLSVKTLLIVLRSGWLGVSVSSKQRREWEAVET